MDLPTGEGSIEIALAIPYRDAGFLVARRVEGSHLAGLWEFPGGKVEPGEAPDDAARRELTEETGLEAGQLEPLIVVLHDYDGLPLRFHVFLARDPVGQVRPDVPREFAWKTYDQLQQLEMPAANQQILRALRWRI